MLPGVGRLNVRVDQDVDGVAAVLRRRIYEFNDDATGLRDGAELAFSVRSRDGTVEAAVYGWIWGGCGYVDLLWVAENLRGQGVGTELMDRAEAAARTAGCTQMVLSTHSFQAPGFYHARGYREVGRTDGYPRGHAHLYLVKALR
jgi:GNAT superfamily N-acetyltransferase